MNIPKIEEAITLLYQTFIEDQDVAKQRGIAITAMNEMVKLLGGDDVVKKIEAVPYSARLRAQHLFEDESLLAKQEQGEPLEYWNAVEGWVKIDEVREHFDSVSCATIYKNGGEGRVPLCLAQPKQEQSEPVAWVNWCAATGKRSVSFKCESELASQPLYFGITQNTQNRYSNQNSLAYERLELVGHADLAINNIYIFSNYGEDVPEGRTPIYAGYKAVKAIKENT